MSPKPKKTGGTDAPRILNRKARHDYHVDETLECGIELVGTEVKAIRSGKVSLAESYARVDPKALQLWLVNADIGLYEHGPSEGQHAPKRDRRLLAHRAEIKRLMGKTTDRGVTLVPMEMYFNDAGRIKVVVAVGRGKAHHDKRQTLKKKDADRAMRQAMTRKHV